MRARVPGKPGYELTSHKGIGWEPPVEPDLEKGQLTVREFEADEWAKEELKRAIERLKSEANEEGKEVTQFTFDRLGAAYDAYNFIGTFGNIGKSGFTRSVLDRLLSGKPLTPITADEDEWIPFLEKYNGEGEKRYQSKRYKNLVRVDSIGEDGNVTGTTYTDPSRIVGCQTYGRKFKMRLLDEIIDEKAPIVMPYMPPEKPYQAITDSFRYSDEKEHKKALDILHRDFDTYAVFSIITPVGGIIPVQKFYKYDYDYEKRLVEISRDEFLMRKGAWSKRIEAAMKKKEEKQNGAKKSE